MSWSRFVCPHCHFNSRPSARGDLLRGKYAQGVHNFNSRPSARGDVLHVVYSFHSRYFNSRPSARGDMHLDVPLHENELHFNSRPSARGDSVTSIVSASASRFQFTPLREGRHRRLYHRASSGNISIHAPPRGAT